MKIKINGRVRFYNHLSHFRRTSKYEYSVNRYSIPFVIFGGKHSGGRRNEWFVQSAEWDKSIACTSLVDALRLIDNM
jgi:hypothetical protein